MSTISRIDVYKLKIPCTVPTVVAYGEMAGGEGLLVRIETGDGLYGLGEGGPDFYVTGEIQAATFEVGRELAKRMIGTNAAAIEARVAQMHDTIRYHGSTKGAFETALWDISGKRAGRPLFELWGGERQTLETDHTVVLDTSDVMAAKAADLKEKGFRSIKIKVGRTVQEDLDRVRAIREAVGTEVSLRIDANQGWDVSTAIATLKAMAPYGIEFCEQPVPVWDERGMKVVRGRSPIAIMADESVADHRDAFRLAAAGACDYLNIKLAKSGGLSIGLKIDAIAEAAGMRCMLGCMEETRLGLTAAAHLAAARPNIAFLDLDGCFFLAEDPVTGGITYDGGSITLPESPGLGADIPAEYLENLVSISIT